jgi:hypothetical protein
MIWLAGNLPPAWVGSSPINASAWRLVAWRSSSPSTSAKKENDGQNQQFSPTGAIRRQMARPSPDQTLLWSIAPERSQPKPADPRFVQIEYPERRCWNFLTDTKYRSPA